MGEFFFYLSEGARGAVRFLEICAEIFEMGVGDTNLLWVCGWGVFVCGLGGGEEERGSDFGTSL